jgi:hypothetical protein
MTVSPIRSVRPRRLSRAAIHRVDAETVVSFGVEARGDEFWAVWGRKPDGSPAAHL